MISTQVVRTLVDAVGEAGVARSEFLRAAGLDAAELQAREHKLPLTKLHDLCALALELTGDPAFGLRSIERLSSDALNPLAALVVHASTLDEALHAIQEFRSLLGDQASFRIHDDDSGRVIVKHTLAADERLPVRRYLAEVTVAGLFCAIRRFRVADRISYAAFEYAAPSYVDEYARVFDGCARFAQPFTGLCFHRSLLTAAAPHPDPELHHALWAITRRRVGRQSDAASCATRLHDHLVWQPPPRDMSMQAAARAIGMSVRSLRRHLAAEGKTYSKIVTEAQTVIAKHCLRDVHRTIHDTASELGFADNASFHRAFKRWTGLTPTEFRKRPGA
ncbi:MAG: AraC family transcriptional regulator ligand-binding domain-containing protein [Polyangiales bacterium]